MIHALEVALVSQEIWTPVIILVIRMMSANDSLSNYENVRICVVASTCETISTVEVDQEPVAALEYVIVS